MEDFILIEDEINLSKTHLSSIMCVIDGHGGWECARFIQTNLVQEIKNAFQGEEEKLENTNNFIEFVRKKIVKCYYTLDLKYYE